ILGMRASRRPQPGGAPPGSASEEADLLHPHNHLLLAEAVSRPRWSSRNQPSTGSAAIPSQITISSQTVPKESSFHRPPAKARCGPLANAARCADKARRVIWEIQDT